MSTHHEHTHRPHTMSTNTEHTYEHAHEPRCHHEQALISSRVCAIAVHSPSITHHEEGLVAAYGEVGKGTSASSTLGVGPPQYCLPSAARPYDGPGLRYNGAYRRRAYEAGCARSLRAGMHSGDILTHHNERCVAAYREVEKGTSASGTHTQHDHTRCAHAMSTHDEHTR